MLHMFQILTQREFQFIPRLFHSVLLLLFCSFPLFSHPADAQPGASAHEPPAGPVQNHAEHGPASAGQWEGSPEGKAYSEFNHHLAGLFVLLIGVSELRQGLAPLLAV